MTDPQSPSSWSGARSAKDRNAVQREVTALLDELAPEKVLTRGDLPKLPIEQHRTPTGCVLQAPNAALSVSWFAPAGSDTAAGELHIVVWRGVVQRRGARPTRQGATIVEEVVFLPIERPTTPKVWRDRAGTEFETPEVAARCLALLKEQVEATDTPAG